MSWYRMVDVRIHGDSKYLKLSPDEPSGRALFKHLLICPENGPLPGVVLAGAATLAEALEWVPERLRERYGELYREGLAEADWKARIVFLPNGIKYNPPNNENTVKGWAKHWDALPDSPLKAKIWERYHAHFKQDAKKRESAKSDGSKEKASDPRALLDAFLRNIPKPETPSSEKELTVTDGSWNGYPNPSGNGSGTVTYTVEAFSAGACARLPEPERDPELNPEHHVVRAREAGRAAPPTQFTLTPEEPKPSPDSATVERIWAAYVKAREECLTKLKISPSPPPKLSAGNRELVLGCLVKIREQYDDAEQRFFDAMEKLPYDDYHLGRLPDWPGARLSPKDVFKINGKINNIEKLSEACRAMHAWIAEGVAEITNDPLIKRAPPLSAMTPPPEGDPFEDMYYVVEPPEEDE